MVCAGTAHHANRLGLIQTVVSLNNMGFVLLEAAHAVFDVGRQIAQNTAHVITHLDEMLQTVGNAAFYTLETMMLNLSLPLPYPARDQRNAEIAATLQNLSYQFKQLTGLQQIKTVTQIIAELIMAKPIMSAQSIMMGIHPEAVALTASILKAKYNSSSAPNVESAASQAAQNVAKTTQKVQVVAQESNMSKAIAKELINAEQKFDKSAKVVVKNQLGRKGNAPPAVDTRCLLDKNLEIAENAKLDAKTIKKLSDGRIRYYEKETPSSTSGPTRGSSYVTEYDPNKGIVRSWYENYDHFGKINRVHPKMINGTNIDSLHYPHTGRELEQIFLKTKGKK